VSNNSTGFSNDIRARVCTTEVGTMELHESTFVFFIFVLQVKH